MLHRSRQPSSSAPVAAGSMPEPVSNPGWTSSGPGIPAVWSIARAAPTAGLLRLHRRGAADISLDIRFCRSAGKRGPFLYGKMRGRAAPAGRKGSGIPLAGAFSRGLPSPEQLGSGPAAYGRRRQSSSTPGGGPPGRTGMPPRGSYRPMAVFPLRRVCGGGRQTFALLFSYQAAGPVFLASGGGFPVSCIPRSAADAWQRCEDHQGRARKQVCVGYAFTSPAGAALRPCTAL